MEALLALDQGTSSSRAMVFGRDGRLLAVAQRELTQHFPRPGWVEHDANEIWEGQAACAREAIAKAGVKVAAIGITNQRETVVLWDRQTGEPLHKALVWQDRRTATFCEDLKGQGLEPRVRELTGLVLDPYFSATKLRWLLDNVDGARARAERGELAFGTVDSWLLWKLTGGQVHATDTSNASRTLLFDIHRGDWSDELLALFGIPRALLPEVRPSAGVYGQAAEFGVPIAGIAGDQQAALFGQGCCRDGLAKNTYGTGAFLLVFTGDRLAVPAPGVLATAACGPRGEPAYALEGSIFIAGAAVQWLRDGLGLIQTAGETEALARSVSDTGGVHFVPAFVGLGTPHWEADARGTITGLTRGTTRAHLARAALESMAFSSAELLQAMAGAGDFDVRVLRVDGGACANDWLMQFQADVIGIPVERPDMVETTALGAAGLAGLALGVWQSSAEFLAGRRFRRFEPVTTPAERRTLRQGWARAVDAALAWARAGGGQLGS
jgi:glycerol kinase